MAFIRPNKKQELEDARLDSKDAGGPLRSSVAAPTSRGFQASNARGGDGQMAGGGDFGRYVSLGEYLGQNRQQAQGMADRVGDSAQNAGSSAENQIRGLEKTFNRSIKLADKNIHGGNATSFVGDSIESSNPSGFATASRSAQSASQQNANLGNMDGAATNLKDAYSAKGLSRGEALWDGAQAQQAGGGRFAQLAGRYGNIGNMLNLANEKSKHAYADLQSRNAAWEIAEEKRKRDEEERQRQERLAAEQAARDAAGGPNSDDRAVELGILPAPTVEATSQYNPDEDEDDSDARANDLGIG